MGNRKSKIKEGDRFGRLLVKRQLPKDEYDLRSVKRTLFECLCDCGNTKVIDAGNLKKGTKSCGCLAKENGRLQGRKQRTEKGYLNNYWGEYRRGAKHRSRDFNLTLDEFIELVSQDCYYCSNPPKIREAKNQVGLPVPVNGIDRIDSSLGYFVENCVPCCYVCNKMKSNYDKEDFIMNCLNVVLTQLEHQDVAVKAKQEILSKFPFLSEVMEK